MIKLNKLNIKIVFFDIDGTLTNTNKEITKSTINTINKLIEKDIYIVLCSGRINNYINKFLKVISKSKYTISNNGALIYDNELNKVIMLDPLHTNDLEYIWKYSNNTKSTFIVNTIKNKYSNKYVKNKKDKIIINNLEDIIE